MSSTDSPNRAYRGDRESPNQAANENAEHLIPSIAESQAFARRQNSEGIAGQADAAGAAAIAGSEKSQAAGKGGEASTGTACPISREYNALIDKAWRNVYDPAPLGDLSDLKNKYNCQIKTPDDAFRFVNQELSRTGDPFSRVLNPTQSAQLDRVMKGASKGVGLEVIAVEPGKAKTTGSLRVIEVIPGSAAHKMGVKKGDYITNVDGVDLTAKKPEEGFALLLAPSTHDITVTRDGQKRELTLIPTTVDIPCVVDRMIPGTNIAYIRVRDFMQDDASYEVQNAVKRYPYADGFVFDVRGNLGGSVDQALQSASIIVAKGTLLTSKTRTEDDRATGPARYDNTDYTLDQWELVKRDVLPSGKVVEKRDLRLPDLIDKPTVILVNGDTASAAEIFAAAIQQNGEGTLIGTKTFGKGIGQTIFMDQPARSRLQVTNFRFFTPNGEWIGDAAKNRIGLTPNEEVENERYAEPESESDKQFRAAIRAINKKLGK
ncbi:MAG: PDZ domain-containing protein [Candidatus Melainabacteria bacterium]|nr:PDZ domain-containing protein [Candidatus Melainabacteria bacterium]